MITIKLNEILLTEDGRWIDYLWPNPDTGKLERKHTWAIRHDGYLFGSEYYQPSI